MITNPSIVNIHPDFLSNFDLQLQQLVDEEKIHAQLFWKPVNHFSSFLKQKVRNVLIPASHSEDDAFLWNICDSKWRLQVWDSWSAVVECSHTT